MKILSKFSCMERHNNAILSILLILFYNVFKTLHQKYMLNLKCSDKTLKMLFCLYVQSLQTWLFMHLSAYIFLLVEYCMGFSLLVRLVDQQRRQLAVRFYSNWYCAMAGVNVLATRFMLALNKYIVHESANIKECPYQVMIHNGLFVVLCVI